MKKLKLLSVSVAALCSAAAMSPAQALVINLNNTGGVEMGTQAFYGFSVASAFWENVISNDVEVNLDVGFGGLPPNVLGSTGSSRLVADLGQFVNALQATGTTNLDSNLVMPNLVASTAGGSAAVDALISAPRPDGTGVALPVSRALDSDGGANNSFLAANTAVLKAVGLLAADAAGADGTVTFSSDFAFDFNPQDGIDGDKIDFIGVAIHEIGHALGFVSGVDVYDINTGFGGDIGNFAIMSALDLFRYSADSAAQGALDWAVGGDFMTNEAPYFSIDGGASVFTAGSGAGFFSTGRTFGDGRQASHWKDIAPPLGLLDPTVSFGTGTEVTSLDLAAYDAMGWNISYDVFNDRDRTFAGTELFGVTSVNAPATVSIMLLGLGLFGATSRRRNKAK